MRIIALLLGVGVLAALLNAALGLGGPLLSDTILPIYGELVLVVAIALRVVLVDHDRGAWAALGCGALAWTGGDVYRLFAFPPGSHRYFPSFADAGYLLLIRARSSGCGC